MTDSEMGGHLGKVSFLIFEGFPMSCLTSMIEPLRAANEIAEKQLFRWQLVSEDGTKTMSSAGVVFDADCALDDMGETDLLVLLGSPASTFADPRHGNGMLRMMARRGGRLGAISGGIFPLARSGVLQGHRCSVHWCYDAAFRAEFPQIDAAAEVIVTDRRCYTVSGSAAAFDLSLQVIADAMGAGLAHEVACWFQHPMRGDSVRQAVPLHSSGDATLPDLVARAIQMFTADLSAAISINEIAEALSVTPRQIERAFKGAVGQSPSHYFRALRMKAARQLVQYSSDSTAQIATAVGYGSAAPLQQHYRAAYGLSPSEDRARINAERVRGQGPLPGG